jgi:error-prone DNA polymerase
MQVAIVCAGFTPSEADQLRRSMATFKMTGGVSHFKHKMIEGMVARGYDREFADRTFSQIEGFGSYGFPESHAASFALIAYASCWMKCHHPAIFCAALLNSQPMGFYAPAQIVRDAAAHGIKIRPVCVNNSRWDSTIEANAVRLGLRMVKGFANEAAARLIAARGEQKFATVEEIRRRADLRPADLTCLAEADAYRDLDLDRRSALWVIRGLRDAVLPLFAAADRAGSPQPEFFEPAVSLPRMAAGREVVEDYSATGLSLRRHPLAFLRADLQAQGLIPCANLLATRDGRSVAIAGLVLIRQRPGSAKGVMFITLEDETGIANLVIWPSLFERQRRLILGASMIGAHGKLQREGEVIHVVADRLTDYAALLGSVGQRDQPFPIARGRGDEATHPGAPDSRERAGIKREGAGIKVVSRDFR